MKKGAAILILLSSLVSAQSSKYWQQHVNYTMDIDVDVTTFQYKGKQKLVYTNNSPDQLKNVTITYISMLFNPTLKWILDLEISKIQTKE